MDEGTFTRRTAGLLSQAEAICSGRGTRLTGLRRQVLGLVLDSPKPAGAYDLLERLRARHKGAAPPTIYRALDFLLDQGLIHKVERLAAFVGCIHGAEPGGGAHHHAVQFLVCRACGGVEELSDPAIGLSLQQAAAARGFSMAGSIVEADGVCSACAAPGR